MDLRLLSKGTIFLHIKVKRVHGWYWCHTKASTKKMWRCCAVSGSCRTSAYHVWSCYYMLPSSKTVKLGTERQEGRRLFLSQLCMHCTWKYWLYFCSIFFTSIYERKPNSSFFLLFFTNFRSLRRSYLFAGSPIWLGPGLDARVFKLLKQLSTVM